MAVNGGMREMKFREGSGAFPSFLGTRGRETKNCTAVRDNGGYLGGFMRRS